MYKSNIKLDYVRSIMWYTIASFSSYLVELLLSVKKEREKERKRERERERYRDTVE